MIKKLIDEKINFDVGAFFKEIRRTRGYTQKDAGGDYISKSQLSRFENGETILTAEKLYYAITQISMTPNEFFNAFNDYKLDRMQELYRTLDNIQLSLKDGIEKSKTLIIKKPKDKFERLSNVMIKSVLQDITGKKYVSREEYLLVGDYLSAIDYWSEFEMKLLYYTCLILDEGDIRWFWEMITDRAHHFNKGNNQRLFLATLLNSYETTVLDRQNMENAALFREDLEKFIVKKEPTMLIIFTIVTYFHDYLLEKTSKNRQKIEEYLTAAELVGAKDMADYYRNRLVALERK
ncbi:MAG: helix-turn-helix domain-containing protein [Lactococcus chungangensis]